MSKIKAVVAELPTYGYRRVHAVLKRQALAAGLKPPNHKRVYRVMKVHGLLLDRHVGGEERRHDGRIAVDERNRRWCSDGFEIGCDNGERVRVAFALDCCDREAMSFLATTGGITGEDVRDLMVAAARSNGFLITAAATSPALDWTASKTLRSRMAGCAPGKTSPSWTSAFRAVHLRSPKAYDQSTSEPLPQPALSASPRRSRPRALTEYEREQSRLWGLQQIRSEPILRRRMWGLLELTELLIAHMGDRFRK